MSFLKSFASSGASPLTSFAAGVWAKQAIKAHSHIAAFGVLWCFTYFHQI